MNRPIVKVLKGGQVHDPAAARREAYDRLRAGALAGLEVIGLPEEDRRTLTDVARTATRLAGRRPVRLTG